MLSFLSLLVSVSLVAGIEQPTHLYEIETEVFPAFCNLIPNGLMTADQDHPIYDLIYSSFTPNPRQLDPVFRVEALNYKYADASLMDFKIITEELVWPNELSRVPNGALNRPYVVVASTGFFITGKDDGEIALLDLTELLYERADKVKISSNDDGLKWYYHRVEWHDMNGDNVLDAITERANGGGPSADKTQLVWFENPGGDYKLQGAWDTHVIKENSEDVHFRLHELTLSNGKKVTTIISSCFYSNELTIVWSDTDDFTDLSSVRSVVIDTYGWYFDIEIVDINNDGRVDVLTSTWSQAGKPGAVLAYEIPTGDWTTEEWPRHILQDGYKSFLLAGTGSPGSAIAFTPTKELENNKPYVMVSGDDDGNAYVLTANSEDTNDWSYTQTTIAKPGGTVGMIAVEDVDHDGYAEIFIPAYTMKKIVVMSYKK